MNPTKQEMTDIIEKHVKECSLNNFAVIGEPDEPVWEGVAVGFSRGDDPYYDFLKKDIGDFHWSPAEVFRLGKGVDVNQKDILVISIGLQTTKKTKELNGMATDEPTLRWVAARGEWENLIQDINGKIIRDMEEKGVQAVSLEHVKEFERKKSEKYGAASTWSHRHAAFASGLGTFGLCDGLITKKGKAMRFTTIFLESNIEADARQYEKYNEWCKFTKDGGCGVCIKRCPVGAVTKDGHHKDKCEKFVLHMRDKALSAGTLTSKTATGCGMCQCGTPCQDGVPM